MGGDAALEATPRVERRRLHFAVWMTALALPIVVADNIPPAGARAEQSSPSGSGAAELDPRRAAALRAQQAAGQLEGDLVRLLALGAQRAVATATTAPTGVSPAGEPVPTPTATPPTTEPAPSTEAAPATTAAPPPPPPTTAPASSNVEVGDASWYHYRPGTCAHRSLPFGTVVTVTNVRTGASATCTVADRGPFVEGRVIDLDRDVYTRLAGLETGVFPARLSW